MSLIIVATSWQSMHATLLGKNIWNVIVQLTGSNQVWESVQEKVME
jgi:hypothetical protein